MTHQISKIKKMEKSFLKKGAIAANSRIGAQTGIDILRKGGSAADAAISTLLVDALANPYATGIGGGFLMTMYKRNTAKIECLNARECAPEKAHKNMFDRINGVQGALSIGVPGELMGFWVLHKKYGILPWKDLLTPAINYCRSGIPISKFSAKMFANFKDKICASPKLKEMLFNTITEDVFKDGEMMKRPYLADTLQQIAEDGINALYNGKLTNKFVEDIQNQGGIITRQDMESYCPVWLEPEQITLPDNLKGYCTPLPGSGYLLFFILQVMLEIENAFTTNKKWFYLVEAWKFAFGLRCSLDGPTKGVLNQSRIMKSFKETAKIAASKIMGGERTFENVHYYSEKCFRPYYGGGTCHYCILAPNGDAISITSSINSSFGSFIVSPSTGIILNNHMMDFNCSSKHVDSKTNQISPYKQPLSSMVPTIVINDETKDVRLIVGGAGATKIITTTSLLIIDNLFCNESVEQSMANKRIHHQLMPMTLYYESGFPYVEELKKRGHTMKEFPPSAFALVDNLPRTSSATMIGVDKDGVKATGDPRRLGVGLVI